MKIEAFESLLLHTKVRWLCKRNCLAQFYLLLDTVVQFLQSCNPGIAKEVIAVRNNMAYLSEIFAKFNKFNVFLQASKVNVIKVKLALSGFDNKLVVYQRNLARQEYFQCLSLPQLDASDSDIYNVDIDTYSKHLQELHKDMKV